MLHKKRSRYILHHLTLHFTSEVYTLKFYITESEAVEDGTLTPAPIRIISLLVAVILFKDVMNRRKERKREGERTERRKGGKRVSPDATCFKVRKTKTKQTKIRKTG